MVRAGQSASLFTNWRLVLLGMTGVVLSLASGWTTWDGLSNFTDEPLLSLMITFGIQGVMLITAWLIGETFAAGLGQQMPDQRPFVPAGWKAVLGGVFAIAGIASAGLLLLDAYAFIRLDLLDGGLLAATLATPHGVLTAIAIVSGVALFIINAGPETIARYREALRIIARNVALWVMFLACMATSVFFSFDSLFTTIFPPDERARTAQVRASGEVVDILSQLERETLRGRLQARTAFLSSGAWSQYDSRLDGVTERLDAAPEEMAIRLNASLEAAQDRATAALTQASRLRAEIRQGEAEAARIAAEIGRYDARIAGLEKQIEGVREQVFAKDQEIISKTAEADAEERGLSDSGKPGRGRLWRAIIAERRILERQKRNLAVQIEATETQLSAVRDDKLARERARAEVVARVEQLKARAGIAPNGSDASAQAQSVQAAEDRLSALRVELIEARTAFEQNPTRAGLDAIQQTCSAAVDGLVTAPFNPAPAGLGEACNPGTAHEAAVRLYALNAGAAAIAATCAGKEIVKNAGGIDGQVAEVRRCLLASNIAGPQAARIRSAIDGIERQRDDKAHRFVVTTNAFGDGNRLAYLAFAIAMTIDALVFISGLFGANVMRSPLGLLPGRNGQTPQQLDRLMETALFPEPAHAAARALETIRPRRDALGSGPSAADMHAGAGAAPDADWSHEVDLTDLPVHRAGGVRRLINAAIAAGAARPARVAAWDATGGVTTPDTWHRERYDIHKGLVTYLHGVIDEARHRDGAHRRGDAGALRDLLVSALGEAPAHGASRVLSQLKPSTAMPGYDLSVDPDDASRADDTVLLRTVANAAVIARAARPADDGGRVFINADVYHLLLDIAHTPQAQGADTNRQPVPATGPAISPFSGVRAPGAATERPMSRLAATATRPGAAPTHHPITDFSQTARPLAQRDALPDQAHIPTSIGAVRGRMRSSPAGLAATSASITDGGIAAYGEPLRREPSASTGPGHAQTGTVSQPDKAEAGSDRAELSGTGVGTGLGVGFDDLGDTLEFTFPSEAAGVATGGTAASPADPDGRGASTRTVGLR